MLYTLITFWPLWIFILFLLIFGFRIVPPNEANIVVRLGKPVRIRKQ